MRLNIADTMPPDDAPRRPHITHFDDCGCLSARKDAEIERLTTALQALDQQVSRLRELLHEAIECIRDNPEASEYAREVVRLARAALREPPDA